MKVVDLGAKVPNEKIIRADYLLGHDTQLPGSKPLWQFDFESRQNVASVQTNEPEPMTDSEPIPNCE